jgi:hypothetical protein
MRALLRACFALACLTLAPGCGRSPGTAVPDAAPDAAGQTADAATQVSLANRARGACEVFTLLKCGTCTGRCSTAPPSCAGFFLCLIYSPSCDCWDRAIADSKGLPPEQDCTWWYHAGRCAGEKTCCPD